MRGTARALLGLLAVGCACSSAPAQNAARAELGAAECAFEWTSTSRYNRQTGLIERTVTDKRVCVGARSSTESLDLRLVEFTPAPGRP